MDILRKIPLVRSRDFSVQYSNRVNARRHCLDSNSCCIVRTNEKLATGRFSRIGEPVPVVVRLELSKLDQWSLVDEALFGPLSGLIGHCAKSLLPQHSPLKPHWRD
jgi:hypothetical protein